MGEEVGGRREVGPSGWRAADAPFYVFLEVGWVCMGVKEETAPVFISVAWLKISISNLPNIDPTQKHTLSYRRKGKKDPTETLSTP